MNPETILTIQYCAATLLLTIFMIIGFGGVITVWLTPLMSLVPKIAITLIWGSFTVFVGALLYALFVHIQHGHFGFMQDVMEAIIGDENGD